MAAAAAAAAALVAMAASAQQPDDPGQAVRDAVNQGADARGLIALLESRDIEVLDATVIAIYNAPQIMAGDITKAAMERVPVDQQENVGYLALSTASGVGSCKVAEVIGMPQPAICIELIRQAEAASQATGDSN